MLGVDILRSCGGHAEHRPSRADVLASNSCGAAPAIGEVQCADQCFHGFRGRRSASSTPSNPRRGAGRGMSSSHKAFHEGASELFIAVTLSDMCRSTLVPPAGFEPALPPPEAGRSRDRGRLPVSYLGFLFALCVSDVLRCAVVGFTGHSTIAVLSGRIR